MSEDVKYLFIDGGYARKSCIRAMNEVFGEAGTINVHNIVNMIRPFRTYYYDCLDDAQRENETDAEYDLRMDSSEAYYEIVRSLPGVHLRLGTLTGKKRRQKEVDVLLAVDMLTHGFRRNMTHAVLLAGDLDFRPVVEAVVRDGVFVQVLYQPKAAAKKLYWAADFGQPLNWNAFYQWSSDDFKAAHPIPRLENNVQHAWDVSPMKWGVHRGQQIILFSQPSREEYLLEIAGQANVHPSRGFIHKNVDLLERYFVAEFGAIEWKK